MIKIRLKSKLHPRARLGILPVSSFALVSALALLPAGCAVNPATGERQLIFISERREIEMGREADGQIVALLGLYDDAELQSYIQDLGAEMAGLSERPNLPWTFRIVDDPVVNAFALPGGFIYITRGIMVHLSSEAQLASVVGHEIGHVTGRHSVEQISRSQFFQLGLGVGSILSPTFRDLSGIAGAGLGLLTLKFGRGDERQADDLGLRYMRRAQYDPREMPGVFELLGRVSQARGGGGPPEWLSTHPDPENRKERIEAAIAALNQDFEESTVARSSYLSRLDGMVYGVNPREGFFRDNLFLHPDLAFQIRFPEGWQTANQKQGVLAVSQNEAIIQLTLAQARSAGAAADAFFAQQGVSGARPRRRSINGLTAYTGSFSAASQQTRLEGEAAFVELGGNVFQIVAYGVASSWSRNARAAARSLRSFDRVTDPEVLSVQPKRLDIFTLPQAMTLNQFARGYSTGLPIDELALINQVDPDVRLPAGTLIKRAN